MRVRLPMLMAIVVAVSCLLCRPALSQTQGTGSFQIQTALGTDGKITPTLTWSTSPTGASCTASGDTAWSGTKSGSGTVTLAATTPPRSYALACSWPNDTIATLNWTAPTTNTDGSSLTNLAGFRINWGVSPTALTQAAQLAQPSVTTYRVENLTAGTWYFAVKAYTSQGVESALSNVTSKVIRQPMQWTAAVGVNVPAAVTNLAVE